MTPAAYIDAHQADFLALLRRLVQIPTVNPPGENYDTITQLLTAELSEAGLVARRLRVPLAFSKKHLPPAQWHLPRWNVLGRLAAPERGRVEQGSAPKTLHFNAHYDVVPVSGNWLHGSPFSGAVKDGWVYGRGTADMKGAIASLLLALCALRATGTPPALNLEVSFTADEETDSELGAGWLVRHADIRPDYALVLEGGQGRRIGCGHNGVVWLEVTVHGKAAHGSTPHQGINALEHTACLVLALREHAASLAARTFTAPNGEVRHPTLNVGGVFSSGEGGKINTVPALARFTIDRRVLPNETVAAAEQELRAFIAATARGIPRCRISVTKVSENHPSFSPPDHPFATALAAHVSRERRCRAVFGTSQGFNDTYFFAQQLKIPTLGHGPGGEADHAVDERASLRDLLASARIYAALMVQGIPG
ncbi:MAG: ArgE/DapE family deacylase [Verrucomicrobia bacterium]|nr:MAG: ArgE/DapE family deacylase [Verrucomicrobiota bacterium]